MFELERALKQVSSDFVSRLIYGVSHDMGASLRHILQFSQILNQNLVDQDEKVQHYLTIIQSSSKQMQELINSLHLLSKLVSQGEHIIEFDSHEMISQIIAYYQQNETQKLHFELSGFWPKFSGCPEHFKVLLTNLIENGICFQPVEKETDIQILLSCSLENHQLVIQVEDNGIGIDSSRFIDIKRPFKRYHDTSQYPGLGMGLTYCDLIAELNQAKLEFGESCLGGLKVIYMQPLKN